MARWFTLLVALLFVAGPACALDRGLAQVLEGRLLAPCCWQQTLDVHESPLAAELRAEIQGRLAAGEALVAVEADLVARYGERLRAIPAGADPRPALGLGSVAMMVVVGLLGLGFFVRRVRGGRTRREQRGAIHVDPTRDPYEHRLDEELAAHGP